MKHLLWSCALVLALAACNTTPPAPEPAASPETATTPASVASPTTATEATLQGGYPAPETTISTQGYPEPEATTDAQGYPGPEVGPSGAYPAPEAATIAQSYPDPADCAVAAAPRFASLIESHPEVSRTLGCPQAAATETAAAWQVFERDNRMLWLESEDAIIALYNGQWHGFEDTFEESDPEVPAGAPTPPSADLLQPIRGFGKVWANIATEMGFAATEEEGYDATVQRFERGWLVTTANDEVLVLEGITDAQQGTGPFQPWHERDGEWVSGY